MGTESGKGAPVTGATNCDRSHLMNDVGWVLGGYRLRSVRRKLEHRGVEMGPDGGCMAPGVDLGGILP